MNETMTDRELDAYLAEHLWGDARCRRCGRRFSFHPWDGSIDGNPCLEPQPYAYSSTGEGMLAVIEATKGHGTWIVDHDGGASRPWSACLTNGIYGDNQPHYHGRADTLPRAVAEAARAALESEA